MKSFTLVSSLLAVAYAAPAPAEAIGEIIHLDSSSRALDPITSPLMKAGVKNGEKIIPRLSMTTPTDKATRIVVKYGTYVVSSSKMATHNIAASGPCSLGNCYVTAMEATIRYPGGVEANIDTGAWLHHIALFGGSALTIWAAGNERPTLRLNDGNSQFGLRIPAKFMMMIDLMSEDVKPKNLTLEITYETITADNENYAKYKPATVYWLTIGEPAAKAGVYSFNTLPMTATSAGKLLYAIGHMHDGGDNMSLKVGNTVVCKSIMHYNARPGYSPTGAAASAGHGHRRRDGGPHANGKDGKAHISDPGACTNFGSIKAGDRLTAVANYDANKYPLMVHNGKKEKLMGNMRVYVGPLA